MIVEFYGNHHEGFDRIPHGVKTNGLLKLVEFRTDCDYAISPYWNGSVMCEVPEGCDFTVHPPIVAPGFEVIEVVYDVGEVIAAAMQEGAT